MALDIVKPKPAFQGLSVAAIEESQQIQCWLDQFDERRRHTAQMLLTRLRFVSRDDFSWWLQRAVAQLPAGERHALYSVRKLDENNNQFWDSSGAPAFRSSKTLGSEDLVYSVISGLVRDHQGRLLDHPPLNDLKNEKIRNYVLIDDSIGSGRRVSDFINAMLANPRFLSWWSFGWIKITILSFARSRQAERVIVSRLPGSDHCMRSFPKSKKNKF